MIHILNIFIRTLEFPKRAQRVQLFVCLKVWSALWIPFGDLGIIMGLVTGLCGVSEFGNIQKLLQDACRDFFMFEAFRAKGLHGAVANPSDCFQAPENY